MNADASQQILAALEGVGQLDNVIRRQAEEKLLLFRQQPGYALTLAQISLNAQLPLVCARVCGPPPSSEPRQLGTARARVCVSQLVYPPFSSQNSCRAIGIVLASK
jgi:hypothetical protein